MLIKFFLHRPGIRFESLALDVEYALRFQVKALKVSDVLNVFLARVIRGAADFEVDLGSRKFNLSDVSPSLQKPAYGRFEFTPMASVEFAGRRNVRVLSRSPQSPPGKLSLLLRTLGEELSQAFSHPAYLDIPT